MMEREAPARGNTALRWLTYSFALISLGALIRDPVHAISGQDVSAYQHTVLAIQNQIEAGKLDQARTQIADAARKYPHDGGIENLLGVVEIQQGNTAAASKAFSKAIVDNPRLVGAYLNLSRVKMPDAATDRAARAEALRLSLKVLQLDPANDEAHYQAATIFLWNRVYRSSLEHLKHLSSDSRAKVGAQAVLCADTASLGWREQNDEAVRSLAANPDLSEQDTETCVPSLRASRRADLIEMLLTAAAKHQPLSPAGQRLLGLAQEAEGKLQVARATLEGAFTGDPKSIAVLEDLTRVAKAANDNQGALGYLAHARDIDPGNAALAYEFGVVCVRMGLFAEARKAIGEALRLEPDNPGYNFGMGLVVSFSADPSQALPYLTRFHALRPKDPEGTLALGAANFRAKDYDAAARWLHQSALSQKTAAEAHYYLGRIARQEGRLADATAELKRSLALQGNQPDALAQLGQISTQDRDFTQASSYFEQALRKDPDNYAANFGLLQLYARTGDARREQQSRRFDELKNMKEEQDKQMMRMIEIHPNDSPDTRK
jgi:tetratricopeptide (TPR) repeat protein